MCSCYQLVTDSILGTIKMEKLWERNFALTRTSQVSNSKSLQSQVIALM